MKAILSAVLLSASAFSQNAPVKAEFEVASIKPSAPLAPGQVNVGVHIDGARVSCNALSLNDYLGIAYQVKLYQIVGPDWLAQDRYAFADTLARYVDRPVVDMTELKGKYDLTIEFSPEDFRAMQIRAAMAAGVVLPPQALMLVEHSNGDSLPTALQTIGLKMESRKAPIEVLVVDHAEKTPTAN